MALKDVEPITSLKRDTAGVFERSRERNAPIAITQNGKVTGVVCDVDVFERQQRAMALLKLIAQGEQDLAQSRSVPHDAAIEALAQRRPK